MLVDITLSAHNGARYLEGQIESVRAQTHQDWRLWVRDDRSTDGTWDLVERLASRDARIHLHSRDGVRLGATLSHEWLFQRLPADVRYLFTADADDVWLPEKVEWSLDGMATAERDAGGPVLVHTDLVVADEDLQPIAPSFWRYSGIAPESTDLGRLLVANVATGPTLLLNQALLDRVRPIPAEAAYHDWWIALVAHAFGRIVSVPRATVLYRRHDSNVTGHLSGPLRGAYDVVRRIRNAGTATPRLRSWIEMTGRQAAAFRHRFESELAPEEIAVLEGVASIAGLGAIDRKLGVFRHYVLPERGWVRNLGLVLRA